MSTDSNSLPPYSGPFGVSISDIEWAQCFSHDIRTDIPLPSSYPAANPSELVNDCDSILLRIFYPSTINEDENSEFEDSKDSNTPRHKHHQKGKEKVYWLPEARYAKGYGVIAGIPPWVGRIIGFLALRNITMPVTQNGPLLQDRHIEADTEKSASDLPKFPVVIFSHGLASCRTTLSFICGEMASYGSVVFAIEHRDASASFTVLDKGTSSERELIYERPPIAGSEAKNTPFRNKQIRHRTQEILKAMELIYMLENGKSKFIRNYYTSLPLTEFTGRLDLSRFSLTGHSFGGGTVLEVLARFEQLPFDLGVSMDAWATPLTLRGGHGNEDESYLEGLKECQGGYQYPKTPVLFINSGSFHWPSNLCHLQPYVHHEDPSGEIDNGWYELIPATHQSFSDAGILPFFHRPSILRWFAMRVLKFPNTRLEEAEYRVWVFANQTRRFLNACRHPSSPCTEESTIVPSAIRDRVHVVMHKGCTVDESLLSKDESHRFRDITYGFPVDKMKGKVELKDNDTDIMSASMKSLSKGD